MSRRQVRQLRQQQLSRALTQMTEALHILDELVAPGELGSHLDLAIAKLGDELGLENHMPVSIEALVGRLTADPYLTGHEAGEPPSPWEIAPV
jgi:hypothetical protein